MTNTYYFIPPSKAFQFQDRPEVLGWGSGSTREAFCHCNSEAQAKFVADAINAEIERRAAAGKEPGA
jgi:hypothetical protein